MSAEDHFVKIMITITHKSNHDCQIVDFEVCNEANLGTHRSHDLNESEDKSSEINRVVSKAFNYFTETTIEITCRCLYDLAYLLHFKDYHFLNLKRSFLDEFCYAQKLYKFPDLVTMIICIDSGKNLLLSITFNGSLGFQLSQWCGNNDFLSFAI